MVPSASLNTPEAHAHTAFAPTSAQAVPRRHHRGRVRAPSVPSPLGASSRLLSVAIGFRCSSARAIAVPPEACPVPRRRRRDQPRPPSAPSPASSTSRSGFLGVVGPRCYSACAVAVAPEAQQRPPSAPSPTSSTSRSGFLRITSALGAIRRAPLPSRRRPTRFFGAAARVSCGLRLLRPPPHCRGRVQLVFRAAVSSSQIFRRLPSPCFRAFQVPCTASPSSHWCPPSVLRTLLMPQVLCALAPSSLCLVQGLSKEL